MVKKIFNNTKRAFALKSDKDIKKSLMIFSLMGRPALVSIGTTLTNIALSIKLPIHGLIKKTIFGMFCGGESLEECMKTVDKMYQMHLFTVFDYASEGKETEEEFDRDYEIKSEILDVAAERREVPFTVFKPTGFGRFALWEKVSAQEELNQKEQEEWERVRNRFDKICKKAHELDTRVLMDAEKSWMQTAADDLIEEMMHRYNKEKVIVYNTVQCYKWNRLQYVKDLHTRAQNGGFKVGLKIVRGAYMEQENKRAKKMSYPTPICEDKEATDVNFNGVLYYTLNHLKDMALYIGTHNEVSTYLAMQLMDEMGISKDDDRVWFSQLYGMSDHISYNLALNGYNSAKFTPFGPVEEAIPYLIRRARENSSVKGQTGRELALLREEKQRREGQFTKRIH